MSIIEQFSLIGLDTDHCRIVLEGNLLPEESAEEWSEACWSRAAESLPALAVALDQLVQDKASSEWATFHSKLMAHNIGKRRSNQMGQKQTATKNATGSLAVTPLDLLVALLAEVSRGAFKRPPSPIALSAVEASRNTLSPSSSRSHSELGAEGAASSAAAKLAELGLTAARSFLRLLLLCRGESVLFNPFVWRPVLSTLAQWKSSAFALQMNARAIQQESQVAVGARKKSAITGGDEDESALGKSKRKSSKAASSSSKSSSSKRQKSTRTSKRLIAKQEVDEDEERRDGASQISPAVGYSSSHEMSSQYHIRLQQTQWALVVQAVFALRHALSRGPSLLSQPDALQFTLDLLVSLGQAPDPSESQFSVPSSMNQTALNKTKKTAKGTKTKGRGGSPSAAESGAQFQWLEHAALHCLLPLLLHSRHGSASQTSMVLARLLLPMLALKPTSSAGIVLARGSVPRQLARNCAAALAVCERVFHTLSVSKSPPVKAEKLPHSPAFDSQMLDFDNQQPLESNKADRDMDEPFHTLLHQLCVASSTSSSAASELANTAGSVPSEWRSHTASTVVQLLRQLLVLDSDRLRFVEFLSRLSKNRRPQLREFSVRVAERWLLDLSASLKGGATPSTPAEDESGDDETETAEQSKGVNKALKSPSHLVRRLLVALLEIIAARIIDRVATVRQKSLSAMATIGERSPAAMRLLLLSHLQQKQPGSTPIDLLLANCRLRVSDPGANVRRAAVRVLESLHLALCSLKNEAAAATESPSSSAISTLLSDDDVGAFVGACADSSLLVRRQAAQSLSALLQASPESAALRAAWRGSVLPLVADDEPSMSDLAGLLVRRICDAISLSFGTATQTEGAWLQLVDELSRGQLAPFVTAAFRQESASSSKSVTMLVNRFRLKIDNFAALDEEEMAVDALPSGWLGCWRLLSLIGSSTGIPPKWTAKHWDLMSQQLLQQSSPLSSTASKAPLACAALSILRASSSRTPAALALRISTELSDSLQKQRIFEPALTRESVNAALALYARAGPSAVDSVNSAAPSWVPGVLVACERTLTGCLQATASSLSDVSSNDAALAHAARWAQEQPLSNLTAALFTLGELGQRFLTLVPHRLILAVQTLIVRSPEATNAQTAASSRRLRSVPGAVRAQALVALGKLCLQSSRLAKQCVDGFARELDGGSAALVASLDDADALAARNNALVIMCDLCSRYASLVDTHLPAIAARLADPAELIRRHALELLGRLLRQDYVRWRAPLFQRFALALVDPASAVRATAEAVLDALVSRDQQQQLQKKASHAATSASGSVTVQSTWARNFVTMLFVLNACPHPKHYVDDSVDGWASAGPLALLGKRRRARRMHIYRHFAQRMTPEERLEVAARVCEDILGAAADESCWPLSREAAALISPPASPSTDAALDDPDDYEFPRAAIVADALAALALPAMQASPSPSAAADAALDTAEDEFATGGDGVVSARDARRAAAIDVARSKLIGKVRARQVCEQIVPSVVALKRRLERDRSPLLRPLMAYLAYLMDVYRNQVQEVLAYDRVLAAEVDYDYKMYLEARAKAAQQLAERREKERMQQVVRQEQRDRELMPPPPMMISSSDVKSNSTGSKNGSRRSLTPEKKSRRKGKKLSVGGVTPRKGKSSSSSPSAPALDIFATPRLRKLSPTAAAGANRRQSLPPPPRSPLAADDEHENDGTLLSGEEEKKSPIQLGSDQSSSPSQDVVVVRSSSTLISPSVRRHKSASLSTTPSGFPPSPMSGASQASPRWNVALSKPLSAEHQKALSKLPVEAAPETPMSSRRQSFSSENLPTQSVLMF